MAEQYDPNREVFDPEQCGGALVEAVRQLATDTGQPMENFTGRTLVEVFQAAQAAYPDLPPFWKTWQSWHAPQPNPEMGDL